MTAHDIELLDRKALDIGSTNVLEGGRELSNLNRRDKFLNDIHSRDAILGVVGLGYVGLPLALAGLDSNFQVLGFDINEERVKQLRSGVSSIKHISDLKIKAAVDGGRLLLTSDLSQLDQPDVIMICVPTPLTAHREPDLSFIEGTAAKIAKVLRPGQLIILESTTYPGTTLEVVKPILEASGLICGSDFFLAFSPEREDPGNPAYSTASIPKVVGGDGEDALVVADAVYSALMVSTVRVSSPSVAEAVKLTENVFRAVNIALVNELKIIYGAMGIDIWEVIEAAKTKPFGFMPFYPGPGLGGHCIPIDPFYLTWKAREYNLSTQFVELAGQINTAMPEHVVNVLASELDARSCRGLNKSQILVLGLAYKKNVDDVRESPALRLMEILERRGARADYHDPYVAAILPMREHPSLVGRRSVDLRPSAVADYDAILIATDHDCVDYETVVANARLVVDTRNICARLGLRQPNIAKA
jgi:UDP-N-acetyl-D-glucosamine dehydrogenase